MSVPNQKIILIENRIKRNKDNLYAMLNLDALREALSTLKGSSLKLWLYFNKNRDGYRFELSRRDCESWGIKKDSYYSAIEDLISKRYLVQDREGSNQYTFYEVPLSANQTNLNSDPANWFGEYQNTYSAKTKKVSENPERNNINNTEILQNNTMSTDDLLSSERESSCYKGKTYLGF